MNEREQILEGNRLARESRVCARHAPFAEHVFRIPESDFPRICAGFPGLLSPDADERNQAFEAFYKSPASEKYRVRRQVRGRARG